jgi:hypothetical protein
MTWELRQTLELGTLSNPDDRMTSVAGGEEYANGKGAALALDVGGLAHTQRLKIEGPIKAYGS